MFFGVVLNAGKVYSQVLENDLVLAQVALGGQSAKKGERSVLEVEVEGHKFVVATLRSGEVEQSQINLHFIAGTAIRLLNPVGSSDLHVLGNYIEEDDDDLDLYDDFDSEDEEGSEFDEDDEDDEEGDEDDDSEEDDSDDEDVFARSASAKRGRDVPQDSGAKKQRTVSETFSKPAEKKTPSKPVDNKTPSKPVDNKTPSKPDNKTPSKPVDNKTPSKPDNKTPSKPVDNKTPSKPDNKTPSKPVDNKTPSKPVDNKTPSKPDNKTPSKASSSTEAPKTAEKVRLPSGLAYQILKAAPSAAPAAKRGQRVVVSYKGTLQQGGKMFDSGDNFDFYLGAGDVIKGWDLGVEGMKVGEKRKLFVPAPLAYGKDGVTEGRKVVIPKNAALDFEVELLKLGR